MQVFNLDNIFSILIPIHGATKSAARGGIERITIPGPIFAQRGILLTDVASVSPEEHKAPSLLTNTKPPMGVKS